MSFPLITSIQPLDKYHLFVAFDDGTSCNISLNNLAGKGVFKVWDEGDTFFKVYIHPVSKAITWNEDIDIDTLQVYCTLKNITIEEFINNNKYATY